MRPVGVVHVEQREVVACTDEELVLRGHRSLLVEARRYVHFAVVDRDDGDNTHSGNRTQKFQRRGRGRKETRRVREVVRVRHAPHAW